MPVPQRRRLSRLGSRGGLALLLILLDAASAFAQTDARPLTALRLEWLTQLARHDAADWKNDLVSAPRESKFSVGRFQDPGTVLNVLRPVLTADYEALRNRLTVLESSARSRREDVQKEWTEVIRARTEFREYIESQEAAYGFEFESGSRTALKLMPIDAALAAWALVALIAANRVRARWQRLARRRTRRAAAATILLCLSLLHGCDLPTAANRTWINRQQAELTTANREAEIAADRAEAAAEKKWQHAVDAWARLVAAPGGGLDALVIRAENEIRDRLGRIAVETCLADRLAGDAEAEKAKMAEEKERLDRLISGARLWSIAAAAVRITVAVALLALCVVPLWRSARAGRAALRRAARQCPRCFKRDRLRVERRAAAETATSRLRGNDTAAKVEKKETGFVECAHCGLRLRLNYLKVPRLCFPAVGIPGSGKTHMLATAYHAVQKGTAPTTATIQPAPSLGDRRFDQYIELIVESRGTAGGTVHALPDPIMIHLRDNDPAGTNSALVNLFDYSGELLNDRIDMSDLRKNAVRMDGFMLFLDPTQLYGGAGRVTLKDQLAKLREFLTDMRDERGIAVGTVIPVPVAICIPKFDLLVAESPIGGQAVYFIRHLMAKLNPDPRRTTLELLAARSELVEQMLPLMFPGVDIRGIVEGFFGKQVMFFPVCSVNLFENELGVADLSRRSAIVPFGVAEPIVWLLHMHGYEVLADRR